MNKDNYEKNFENYLIGYRLRRDYNYNVEKALIKSKDYIEELNTLNGFEKNIFLNCICEIFSVSTLEELIKRIRYQ